LLQLSDFPDGWTAAPFEPDSAETAAFNAMRREAIAECVGVDPALLYPTVMGETTLTSSTFISPDGESQVVQRVGLAPDGDTAEASMEAMSSPLIPDCYESVSMEFADDFPEELPEGLTVTNVTMEQMPKGLPEEEAQFFRSVWYDVTIDFEVDGVGYAQYLVLRFERVGSVMTDIEVQATSVSYLGLPLDDITDRAIDKAEELSRTGP
jgi:hypothetical protein